MDCQAYKELIAAHVDSALSADEQTAAQTHLRSCSRCDAMFIWEARAKAALKRRLGPISPPPALRQRVLERLPGRAKPGSWARLYFHHGWAVGLAGLLLLVLPFLSWREGPRPDLFASAIDRYQKVVGGAAETQSGAVALTPAARLLDLSPWGYRVLARQSQQVGGMEARAFVYKGAEAEYLLAQEFEGVRFAVPAGAKAVKVASREFVGYSDAGVNLVAWQEKDMVCILASKLPQERLFRLAQEIARAS